MKYSTSAAKRIIATTTAVILALTSPGESFAGEWHFETKDHLRTTWLTQDQYRQFIEVIHTSVEKGFDSSDIFFDTGIKYDSVEDAEAAAHILTTLCPDHGVILDVSYGYEKIRLSSVEGSSYRFTYSGYDEGTYGKIFACWNPDVNAEECIYKMDQMIRVLDSVAEQARGGVVEKCRYFNDWLSERITYDKTETRYSMYYGLCEGTSVCQGYSQAFFWLCFKSGIDAAGMPVITEFSKDGLADHERNAVLIDGIWKMVDVTWNDTDPGIRYDYFLTPMSEEWQEFLNSPYMVIV
ncbi:MAG: hypothetical protein IJT43_10610 [Stomatobaculum sp.]|nr:hypothetical protein [Stomatobaculum sp.]